MDKFHFHHSVPVDPNVPDKNNDETSALSDRFLYNIHHYILSVFSLSGNPASRTLNYSPDASKIKQNLIHFDTKRIVFRKHLP